MYVAHAVLLVTASVGLTVLFVGLSKASKIAPMKTTLGKSFRTGTGLDVLVLSRKKSAPREAARYKKGV